MHLKRSWYSLQAFVLLLVAALLLGSTGCFMWYLVTHSALKLDLVSIFLASFGLFFLAIPLIIAAAFIGVAVGVAMRARMLKAAAQNDLSTAPEATMQPNRALALRDGETLSLNIARKSTRTFRSVATTTLGMLVFAGLGMGLVIFTLPAFSPLSWLESSLFGEEAGAVSPGLADWATFAYPVVLSLIFVIAFIASALSGKEQAIVADDQGISVLRTRGRRRHHSHPPLLPQGRSLSTPLPAAGGAAQEGQPPPQAGGQAARQSAPEGEAPAARLPAQDRTCAGPAL